MPALRSTRSSIPLTHTPAGVHLKPSGSPASPEAETTTPTPPRGAMRRPVEEEVGGSDRGTSMRSRPSTASCGAPSQPAPCAAPALAPTTASCTARAWRYADSRAVSAEERAVGRAQGGRMHGGKRIEERRSASAPSCSSCGGSTVRERRVPRAPHMRAALSTHAIAVQRAPGAARTALSECAMTTGPAALAPAVASNSASRGGGTVSSETRLDSFFARFWGAVRTDTERRCSRLKRRLFAHPSSQAVSGCVLQGAQRRLRDPCRPRCLLEKGVCCPELLRAPSIRQDKHTWQPPDVRERGCGGGWRRPRNVENSGRVHGRRFHPQAHSCVSPTLSMVDMRD
jgi:hypothetical protein